MSLIDNFPSASGGGSGDSYELMTLVQEDVSEATTTSYIAGGLFVDETYGKSNSWQGTMQRKQDKRQWPFEIAGSGIQIDKDSSVDSNDEVMGIWPVQNGSTVNAYNETINTLLARTSDSSSDYLQIQVYKGNYSLALKYDFLQECVPQLNCCFHSEQSSDVAYNFYGSNTSFTQNWELIENWTGNIKKTITPTKAYRYYMVRIDFSGTSFVTVQYRYCYFNNVPDYIWKYINNFNTEEDFIENGAKKVIVPSYGNVESVKENYINSLPVDSILRGEQLYDLRYCNGVITNNIPTLNSIQGSLASSASKTLTIAPKLVLYIKDGGTSMGVITPEGQIITNPISSTIYYVAFY